MKYNKMRGGKSLHSITQFSFYSAIDNVIFTQPTSLFISQNQVHVGFA